MSEKNTVKNFFSLSIETFFSPLKIESYNCGERYLDNWLAISSISLLFSFANSSAFFAICFCLSSSDANYDEVLTLIAILQFAF